MTTRKIKDAKDLSTSELIYFKGHAKATFMSDGKTVEDAINQIGMGGGGGITVETDPVFSASPAASITEAKKTEWDNKYAKPSGGIPASDLASDVFLQGEKGDKGDKGDTGATGANGTNGKDGADGEDGATFTPSVDANGNLSWTNNKGLSNPPTVNIKGPKGDSGEGGGGGGVGVYITPFTVEEFCTGWVELTDEQRNGLLNAASQNRIIGMPYEGDYQAGYIVADYKYFLEEVYWSLDLGVIYNGAHYSNSIASNANLNFGITRLTITPFKPLICLVTVEDGVALVSDDSTYTDNCIFWVDGECSEVSVYLEPSEIGKTVRFFTGESCTLEIGYPAYWANGEVPTIEPYTHYELSLTTNAEYCFNAVLTPFKTVE